MLTRDFERVFEPGVPARDMVPPQPEMTVCQPPPEGSWVHSCERIDVPANSSEAIPPGGTMVVVYDPTGEIDPLTGQVRVIDAYIQVCSSRWVPAPNAGGPVCTTYPAVPYQPAVPYKPPRWSYHVALGWDAGANSVQSYLGDCEAKWDMGKVVGVQVGLTIDRAAVPSTERLTHALFFHQRNSVPHFRIMEGGVSRSGDFPYAEGDEFAIRRAQGAVSYWHNGVEVQESGVASYGRVLVGTALYASGDALPTSKVDQ